METRLKRCNAVDLFVNSPLHSIAEDLWNAAMTGVAIAQVRDRLRHAADDDSATAARPRADYIDCGQNILNPNRRETSHAP